MAAQGHGQGQGGHGGGEHAAAHDPAHHIIPLSIYLKVIGVLFFLTFITVFVAQFDFGQWNTVIAFLIATVKATLVLAFFMHLKYDDMMNRVIILSGVFFLIVMYFFCFLDETTRIIQRSTL
jgi:cytochrome c oxidase subunit 4